MIITCEFGPYIFKNIRIFMLLFDHNTFVKEFNKLENIVLVEICP